MVIIRKVCEPVNKTLDEATNGHELVTVEANVRSVPNGAPTDQIKKPL